MMEGISHEVCSLAEGTCALGKLVAFYMMIMEYRLMGRVDGWFTDDYSETI